MWIFGFFFSSRRRHTRFDCDWSSDVCSSDLRRIRRREVRLARDLRIGQLVVVGGGDVHEPGRARSEEHTSELQSQSNLVCRLLLEKKKTLRPPLRISAQDAHKVCHNTRLPRE